MVVMSRAAKSSRRWRCLLGVTAAMTVALAGCSPGPLDPITLDPHAARSSLIGYWSFDDGAGTIVKDQSPFNHDGTIAGSASWITGRFGGALAFDGHAEVSVPVFPQPAGQPWSITAWVRTDPSIDTGM